MSDTDRLAPRILMVLRAKNGAATLEQLLAVFYGTISADHTMRSGPSAHRRFAEISVVECLEKLEQHGVVKLARTRRSFFGGQQKIESALLSSSFNEFQRLIGFSLTQASERNRQQMSPIFGRPNSIIDADVFVVMPLASSFDPVDNMVRRICAPWLLNVKRGDDVFGTSEVMKDVWAGIHNAKLVIADCSGRNANVFYELGIAHTVGNAHTILLAQSEGDIPFDLRHRRFIIYSPSDLIDNGGAALAEALIKTMTKMNAHLWNKPESRVTT